MHTQHTGEMTVGKVRKRAGANVALRDAMTAVATGQIPNVTALRHVGTIKVDDPNEAGPPKIIALRSLRDDPLGRLHIRHQIDDAQYHAGRFWQACYEASEIGGIAAIDPGKEAVDGGRFPEVFTDRQRKAIKSLAQATSVLGSEGDMLIRAVLGERSMTVEGFAALRGLPKRSEVEYWGKRLRECLDSLAEEFGFSTGRHNRTRETD